MLRLMFTFMLLPFVLIIGFVIMIAAVTGGVRTQLMAACGQIPPSAGASEGAGAGGAGAAAQSATAGHPTVARSPGALSPARIAELAMAAGFSGDEVAVAVAVSLAESGGRPNIDNAGLNSDGSVDYGLWQINSVHSASGFDPARAFDPVYNAAWARRIFLNAGGSWTPWTTYDRGAHQQFMGVAAAAAATASPRPEEQLAAAAVNTGGSETPQPGAAGCTTPTQLINTGFPAEIEPYQPSDPQTACDPTPKPGVVQFKDVLLATYPVTGFSGIARECGGGTSEHKEGRAFDWGASVSNPEQRAAVDDALGKILATDEHGNTHALFRRLGLMYIIWNRQIISSSRIDEGWRPYECVQPADSDTCHTAHVHFSFSWAGAMGQTSWFTSGSGAAVLGQTTPAS